MTLHPTSDCILIDPEPPPAYHVYKQYEHIVVPDAFSHGPEDRPVWGKVLACGSGCKQPIAIGSRVVFGKYAGARITYEKKPFILVREDEILAIDA